jgi:hypothetical protein
MASGGSTVGAGARRVLIRRSRLRRAPRSAPGRAPRGGPAGRAPAPQPERDAPQHLAAGAGLQQALGDERREAGAVAEHLAQQRLAVGAVVVPHQRGGLVDQRATGPEHADEDVEVLTAAGARSGAERLVEAPELDQQRAVEGQVRPGAEDAGRVGVEGVRRRGAVEVEALGLAPGRPRGRAGVEVLLGRAGDLGGGDESGHTSHIGGTAEALEQSLDPAGVDRDVVVGVGEVGAPGLGQSLVARAGQAGSRLDDVAEPRIRGRRGLDHPARAVVGGGVVDDQDLEVRIRQRGQPVEAGPQLRGTVAGAHDDGDQRVGDDTVGAGAGDGGELGQPLDGEVCVDAVGVPGHGRLGDDVRLRRGQRHRQVAQGLPVQPHEDARGVLLPARGHRGEPAVGQLELAAPGGHDIAPSGVRMNR